MKSHKVSEFPVFWLVVTVVILYGNIFIDSFVELCYILCVIHNVIVEVDIATWSVEISIWKCFKHGIVLAQCKWLIIIGNNIAVYIEIFF